MQSGSSNSVEVIFLDNEAVIEEIRRAAATLIGEDEDVISVRLFGSLAAREATPDSDADILITVRRAEGRYFERAEKYEAYFDNLEIKAELFVYSEDELERMRAGGNAFIEEILDTGLILAEK